MEQEVYRGKVIRVTEHFLEGVNYEKAYLKEGIIIIPVVGDKTAGHKILFVRERRPHENPPIKLKLVTGFCEPGNSVEEDVNRELQEEIGMKASKVFLYEELNKTGTINERKRYMIAAGLAESRLPNPDGDVILGIEAMNIDEVESFVLSGKYGIGDSAFVLLKFCHDVKAGKLKLS